MDNCDKTLLNGTTSLRGASGMDYRWENGKTACGI